MLNRTLVLKQQTAQDVAAYAFPITIGASILVVLATAAEDIAIERVESDVLSVVDQLQAVSDDDVARAISLIEARHLTDLQRGDHRADAPSMMTTIFDDPARVNTEIDRYREVTTSDVREFASAYFGANNRSVLTYVPKEDA